MSSGTCQLSERVIFGSGFFDYPWWRELERVGGWEDTAEGEAPDGWLYRVEAVHPQLDDSSVTTHVSHSVLMGVMGAIYNFKLQWGAKVSRRLSRP
ncbi:hypothetical protein [Streptomyces sp. NPDC014622]|uniref:hypothetical protein n=1 Tax=Streptomyces sp. NPDC014622 TaxID=3364874 RepID=UPI0036F9B2C7